MNDLSSVMSAFKDMMKNKMNGSYPVNLNEIRMVISTLVNTCGCSQTKASPNIRILQTVYPKADWYGMMRI